MDEQTRLSLWLAFSRFFLDTELSDSDFAEVARVIDLAHHSRTPV